MDKQKRRMKKKLYALIDKNNMQLTVGIKRVGATM